MNNDKEHQFELLVRQHKRTIYTVCYMFSHDKAEIDDLFQEILIRLWNGFDNYEGPDDVVMLNVTGGGEKRFHAEHEVYHLQPTHIFKIGFTKEEVERVLAEMK